MRIIFICIVLLDIFKHSICLKSSIISINKLTLVSIRPENTLHSSCRNFKSLKSTNTDIDDLLVTVSKNTVQGSIVVIKYGGHAMENDALRQGFCEDIGALCRIGIIPIVVHGGGPQIEKMLKELSVESKFILGLRVTDKRTMEIAQMVLCGSINKDIVGAISNQPGVKGCIGLSGRDSNLIKAKVLIKSLVDPSTGETKEIDLGLVGEPTAVNTELLLDLLKLSIVPVIAPVATGESGESLNINADTVAGAVAEALKVT